MKLFFIGRAFQISKSLAISFVVAVLLQIAVSYPRVPMVFPFLRYPMYAAREKAETFIIYRIEADGKVLQPASFTPFEENALITPLLFLSNTKKEGLDLNSFKANYIRRVSSVTGKSITVLTVSKQYCVLKNDSLIVDKSEPFL